MKKIYCCTDQCQVAVKRCCLGLGPSRVVIENLDIYKYVSRTRVLKNNGEVEYSDWLTTGYVDEGKFEDCPSLMSSTALAGSCRSSRSSIMLSNSLRGDESMPGSWRHP